MNPKQECHGGRRRLHSRALLGSLVLASSSLSACGDDQGEDSADLQAILHDGDLTQVMRSMLTAPPRRRAPAAATAGQSTGGTGGVGRGRAARGHRGTGGLGRHWRVAARAGSGTAGSTGGPGPTRSFPREAQGFWRFDDCNMGRTELGDSSFSATTRRSAR